MNRSSNPAHVRYVFPEALLAGRLLRRYQRFLADVELEDGRVVTAHCPNSGSMLGCLEPGAPVYCSRQTAPQRRTAFTWEMILINGHWVGINTLVPNAIIARAAEMEALPLFRGVLQVRREVRVAAHTRIDLVLERSSGPLFVEVKNVTLVRDEVARFPDAPTVRGVKHLQQLTEMASSRQAAAMVYVVQRLDARCFAPADDIDPAYAQHFERARAHGVQVVAVEARVTPREISLGRVLPLLD
jgi:sugar fermentation stimulation protein A